MLDLTLRIPPFNVRVRSPFTAVDAHLAYFYRDFTRLRRGAFVDFDVRLLPGKGLHRYWRPQARYLVDDQDPFLPLPVDQAAPMLEWGLNWTIASRALGYVVLHAAVLARDDRAIVLPGFPGAGKSTLCAALAHLAHWRLLSDELAILDPQDDTLVPNPRPISLKNASIDLVADFPGARIGPRFEDTRKGTVAHAAVPQASVHAAERPARPHWLVFPTFVAGGSRHIERISRAEAFSLIHEQSFNRERMGDVGFEAVCRMLDAVGCYRIEYGTTADALAAVAQIAGGER